MCEGMFYGCLVACLALTTIMMPKCSADVHSWLNDGKLLHWKQRVSCIHSVHLALHFMHNLPDTPLWHRDTKPGNILLEELPSGQLAFKLTDYGLAVSAPAGSVVVARGTTGYTSARHFSTGVVDPDEDGYMVGRTMLHLLTGSSMAVEQQDGTWVELPFTQAFTLPPDATAKWPPEAVYKYKAAASSALNGMQHECHRSLQAVLVLANISPSGTANLTPPHF